MLEVIHKGSATESHPVPLLFVHGSWHAAWYWDEHFLDYFGDRGYACHALSLRGHGGSPGRERLRRTGIQDYVADVAAVAQQLPTTPILVAHSMGGFIAQKYLERHTAPAAVLLAPVPPSGVLRVTLNIARRHPVPFAKVNAALRLGPLVTTRDLVRELFFSPSTPDDIVDACYQRVQDESYRAFLDMLALNLVRTKRIDRVPMLLLGAEHDPIVLPREIRCTAALYGAESEVYPDMGHNVMLEPRWQAVAERIDAWLTAQAF